ncbi:MAG: sulfatase-like hydrolase/transferase, partial [Fimbriimonadaceae bacterium]|nr:sulfatase-like hydrolase/transferase [Chitinophagales bacterium]
GLVMPPQPDPPYDDFYNVTPFSRFQIPTSAHNEFYDWPDTLAVVPFIDAGLTDGERDTILADSKRANAIMAYLAAIRFVDEQVGRFLDSLAAYPDIYNNTIIIFTSDHGYAWGEKKHYGKSLLYETDIRMPLIIADLRDPHEQVTERTVSLIDIFPTLCDYAGVDYPVFPDGTNYLDGQSLMPLLQKADTTWERPVLSQIKNSITGLVCFPQNSIRNERFHFIQFNTHGGSDTACDIALSEKVYELYEIGQNRDVDPYEWNNLAEENDYDDLINYFEDCLPGGDLYLVKMHDVIINTETLPCFADYDDTIHLSATLYSQNGILISDADSLSDYTFAWRNSLTPEVYTGINYDFAMSGLSDEQYDEKEKIVFYLTVRKNSILQTAAFELQYVYINPANTPSFEYDITADSATLTLTVNDYLVTGNYTDIDWNFGDGFIADDFLPAPHTYAAAGPYTFENILYYGNGCSLSQSEIIFDFDTTINISELTQNEINIYPNPSTGKFTITTGAFENDFSLALVNSTGQVVYKQNISSTPEHTYFIDIRNLPAANYVIRLYNDNFSYAAVLQLVK